jgi:hypothetical protein
MLLKFLELVGDRRPYVVEGLRHEERVRGQI